MKHWVNPVFVAAMLLVLPAAEGWGTLMSEGLEAEFPHGLWHIGRTGDRYLWGRRLHRHAESFACAG
ncbi:MAG: hypothetical protein GX605_10210 [Chloroflexi bacterium]|nr:hypothetical protein [Chloroflexota bacterium]